MFWTLQRGLGSLPERLSELLAERGAEVHLGQTTRRLERHRGRWSVHTDADCWEADALVLAVPAPVAAALLRPHEEEASRLLGTFSQASVCVVTLALPADAVRQRRGTGLLVPRASRAPAELDDNWLVTAVTYLSDKWPHLAAPPLLLRASTGRFGDDRGLELGETELTQQVCRELEILLGAPIRPTASRVTRWPRAFPQYRVHHNLRVTAIRAALQRLPAVTVAGASYDGVGIPACIANGRQAAATVRAAVGD